MQANLASAMRKIPNRLSQEEIEYIKAEKNGTRALA